MHLNIRPAAPRALSKHDLVSITAEENGRLHMVTPRGRVHAGEWISDHRDRIEQLIDDTGAVWLRGFGVGTEADFDRLMRGFSHGQEYVVEDQNRHNQFVSDDENVWFHNDYCDRPDWPRFLVFWCERSGTAGGETPFVDCARLYRELPSGIVRRFEEQGWILRRRFYPGIGADGYSYFKTDSVEEIQRRLNELDAFDQRWDGDRLAGFSIRFRAAFTHPASGLPVWANNILFSNIAIVEPTIRRCMLRDYVTDELPVNTYWGDGEPIDEADIAAMRVCYAAHQVCIGWAEGDVLILDNLRCAHGRRPIKGLQRVNVGVCDHHSRLNAYC